MSMRLRRTALLTVVCLGTLAVPAPAETTSFTTDRQTTLSAGSGVLLYSAWDEQANEYKLMQRADGVSTPVPVAGSPREFQADVGPTASGHAFYVYSRCETAPGSCDLYVFNPKTGVEQRSKASDEKHDDLLPTYWKGRLAFVRDYGTREKPKQIVYNRPNGTTSRSERLPGLPSQRCDKGQCIDPGGRFEAIELYGDRLAQTATSDEVETFPVKGKKPEVYRSTGVELRLVDRDLKRSRRLAQSGQGEGGQDFSGLAFDRGRLFAGFTCVSCARLKAGIYRYAYADQQWAFATESSNVRTYDLSVGDGTFSRERDNEVPGVISGCDAGGDNGEGAPPDLQDRPVHGPGLHAHPGAVATPPRPAGPRTARSAP